MKKEKLGQFRNLAMFRLSPPIPQRSLGKSRSQVKLKYKRNENIKRNDQQHSYKNIVTNSSSIVIDIVINIVNINILY